MSMINDALKRAKKAQQENPSPTPSLQFRPVEPAQEGRPRAPLLIVAATLMFIGIIAMGGILIWIVAQKREANFQESPFGGSHSRSDRCSYSTTSRHNFS
jgi:hypothetical protein